jgi:hypothetical protein
MHAAKHISAIMYDASLLVMVAHCALSAQHIQRFAGQDPYVYMVSNSGLILYLVLQVVVDGDGDCALNHHHVCTY